jgi:hypothetical protein
MSKQNEREDRIYSKLELEKLPFKLSRENFKVLGRAASLAFLHLYSNQVKSVPLKWCFSTIKKFKIFLVIFHANERGEEIYKEQIAKQVYEYSYKTISKIIDEGLEKGIFLALKQDGNAGLDAKIKNIRPSEELMIDFLNWTIDIFESINNIIIEKKTIIKN